MKIIRLLAFLGMMGWAQAASAETLLLYDFTGGTQLPNATASDVADLMTSAIVRGSTLTGQPAGFATDWDYAPGSATPASEAALGNSYFSLTLAPKSGVSLSLASLTFGAAFYESGGASNPSVTNYVVRSSADNYASDLATFAVAGQTTASPVFALETVDLSGAAFQDVTGAVVFRIYVWDSITGATRLSAIDNLTVTGAALAAVPEPSLSALALAGGAALLLLRRRRPGVDLA